MPQSPGVYINELNASPNSIVEVPSSLTMFVGYTETTTYNGKSLLNTLTPVSSMTEFESYFGKGPLALFSIVATNSNNPDFSFDGKSYQLQQQSPLFLLYNSVRLFYANGGANCVIVSVGDYSAEPTLAALADGLQLVENTPGPALLAIPDAMALAAADAYTLQQKMIDSCGTIASCFAILDIFNGWLPRDPNNDVITNFRNAFSGNFLGYGAAYYPWLNTVITGSSGTSYLNFSDRGELADLLIAEQQKNFATPVQEEQYEAVINSIRTSNVAPADPSGADDMLRSFSPLYVQMQTALLAYVNRLPPSGAIAGVYTMVDNQSGVFKAPANVSVSSCSGPTVLLDDAGQADLNASQDGKAVNAIRAFSGRGILVWGARTLDGNSDDWRYINVRRTLIQVEQSIKNALTAYTFAANDATTWGMVKAQLSNYLTGKWQQGALVGATAASAFSVSVGLGITMTSDDLLNGVMIVSVQVAVTHPAEFIVLTFQQQMQG